MVSFEDGELPKEGLIATRESRREGQGEPGAAGAEREAEGVGGQGGGYQRQPSDQGFAKLEQAKELLLGGGAGANINDVGFL